MVVKLNIPMKKITLTESDLLKIMNKIINEQEDKEFDEDQIELLHFIFEREFKPPFRKGERDGDGDYLYYNRNDDYIGWLDSDKDFELIDLFILNIRDKVCSAFEYDVDGGSWWKAINPHLKSWLEGQLNIKLGKVW